MKVDRSQFWTPPDDTDDQSPLSGPAMDGFVDTVVAAVARRIRAKRQVAALQGNVTRIGAPPPCDPDTEDALSSPMLAPRARRDRDWIRIQ